MRNKELLSVAVKVVEELFEPDVAEVFIADEMFPAVARKLNDISGTRAGIEGILAEVARDLEDSTADWLVTSAASPAGWLYSRL